jgi:hypothetical protein
MTFDAAARIADAVLCEGYVLYPYRALTIKNRLDRKGAPAGLKKSWFRARATRSS